MYLIISSLLLLSGAALILGLIRPPLIKMKSRLNVAAAFAVVNITVITVGIAIMPETKEERTNKTSSAKPASVKEVSLSKEEIYKKDILAATKDGMFKIPSNSEIELVMKSDSTYLVNISYFEKHSKIENILWTSHNTFKAIFEKPSLSRVSTCSIFPHAKLVDKYGQESAEQIARFTLSRPVAQKVRWANISEKMLLDILFTEGQAWVHPAIKKDW